MADRTNQPYPHVLTGHARARPSMRLVRGALTLAVALAAMAAGAPVASAYIYWTDIGPTDTSSGTTIGRVDLDGTGATTKLVADAAGPSSIVSDGGYLYWANNDAGVYSIGRANIDGGSANPEFISGSATSRGVFAVTTDGTYIYWTDGTQYVGRANINGTGADPTFINMGSQAPFGIAAYDGTLYIGELQRIMEAPSNGESPPTQLVTLSGDLLSVAAADGYVYWTENILSDPLPDGYIGRVQTNGIGGFTESYVSGLQQPSAVATDGNELYWVDHGTGEIGRATISSPVPINIQPDWITDATGPWGIALDSAIDPTQTSVTCNPPSLGIGAVSACTAIVSDSASTSVPTGNVVFNGGSAYFSGGNECTVTARPAGGASCTVAAASLAPGEQLISAAYSGDAVHATSIGGGGFCTGTAAQCGVPGSGPGSKAACKVPRLKGKTLAAARRLLSAAHCRLGRIVRPRARKGHAVGPLVVGSARPGAGTVLPSGAKVSVRLIARIAHSHR